VLAQTNNNLLLWDTNSGEIIQQITNTCEFSKRQLEPLPVLEMTWNSYQDLFPEGEILFNEYTNPVERILELVMPPVEAVHSGEDWMFPTVDLEDTRLPSKEKVIGIKDGGEAIAYTREYLRNAGVVNTRVGEKSIVIAHIPEHDIFVAFDRARDGEKSRSVKSTCSETREGTAGSTPRSSTTDRCGPFGCTTTRIRSS